MVLNILLLVPFLVFQKTSLSYSIHRRQVANFVYSRWNDAYPVLKSKLDEVHEKFVQEVKDMDEQAMKVYDDEATEQAIAILTKYSVSAGDEMQRTWTEFFGYLFVRFRDFIIMEKDETNKACGCNPSKFSLSSF